MEYLLGIDNGGTLSKAAVFDRTGAQLSVSSRAVPMIAPRPGFTERDMDALYAASCAAAKEAVLKAGVRPEDIVCVGLAGHGKGLYAADADGKPAYNGIVSTDNRAAAIAERFEKSGVSAEARKKTFQSVLACQPVCLLRWLKENERTAYGRIRSVFSVKDYIRFRLTGRAFAELTDVSGTNLLNLETKNYDKGLLELFGIPEVWDALPPLKRSVDLCGAVTPDAAALTGLKAGTPVCGGMFDIDACGLGVGMTDGDVLTVIAGTWSINEYIRKRPVSDGSVKMNSLYCIDGYYLAEECSPTSIGNLEWWLDGVTGRVGYAELNAAVDRITPEENDLYYLPFIYASNEGGNERGALIGLSANHRKFDIFRAVYEGVVFSHKAHIDRLLKSRDKPASVRLAGGAANSGVLTQMFADVLDLPVDITADKELGCFGACIAAGAARGLYPNVSEAAGKMVRLTKTVLPDPEKREVYERKYARYREMIGALKGVWSF